MLKSVWAKTVLNILVPVLAPVLKTTAEAWRAWALAEIARRLAKLPQPPQPPTT